MSIFGSPYNMVTGSLRSIGDENKGDGSLKGYLGFINV